MNWQPTASWPVLQRRAQILARLRQFFAEKDVLEVDVPIAARSAGTDPNIESFRLHADGVTELKYLLSSPEFYLKRLLAIHPQPVYSLGKAFRAEECGCRHRPEFTMLEWYRPGWTLEQLRREVLELIGMFIASEPRQVSYRQLFVDAFSMDPHQADLAELRAVARQYCAVAFDSEERSVWLDLLFSHVLEPGLQGVVVVDGFPAQQAALAQVREDEYGNAVAERFEVYVDGVELANAYLEEQCARELRTRFTADCALRAARGQTVPMIDELFLQAMEAGLPACTGVALGVDRLVMLTAGLTDIRQAMPFADA